MLCLFGIQLQAQQMTYHDASCFPLLGKATQDTGARYERLPDSLKNISRPPLWNLSRNSAGMAIRFRSNSTRIALKWENLFNNHMNHMTDVGIKGLDLYCWEENGQWRFVNSARPNGKTNQATVIANMQPKEREYMLYLPLYDGLVSLSIGVDSLSSIDQPQINYPIREKPIVFYGTSILQGGCASRPGMAHTNIISRRLNRECINLGFSGNGQLDLEVARVMAEAHEVTRKNQTLNEIFNSLKKKGEKDIYLIHSEKMIGEDGEATVDGIHFTDLGMMRYANLITPFIKKMIKR